MAKSRCLLYEISTERRQPSKPDQSDRLTVAPHSVGRERVAGDSTLLGHEQSRAGGNTPSYPVGREIPVLARWRGERGRLQEFANWWRICPSRGLTGPLLRLRPLDGSMGAGPVSCAPVRPPQRSGDHFRFQLWAGGRTPGRGALDAAGQSVTNL